MRAVAHGRARRNRVCSFFWGMRPKSSRLDRCRHPLVAEAACRLTAAAIRGCIFMNIYVWLVIGGFLGWGAGLGGMVVEPVRRGLGHQSEQLQRVRPAHVF